MKLRVTLTVALEYEPDPFNYPRHNESSHVTGEDTGATAEEALSIDLANFEEDPDMFLERVDIAGSKWHWKGEIVK
jgi:hypothetical protein